MGSEKKRISDYKNKSNCIILIDKSNYLDLENDKVKWPLKTLYPLHGGFAVIMSVGENGFI